MVRHYKPTGRPCGRPRKQRDVPLASYGVKTGEELMPDGLAFSDFPQLGASLPTFANLQRAIEAPTGGGRLDTSEGGEERAVGPSRDRTRELMTPPGNSAPQNPDEET